MSFSLTNASAASVYLLAQPYGPWYVDGVTIAPSCLYLSCPDESRDCPMGINECPLVRGFEQVRPGEVVEFEWTHELEVYGCSGEGGKCEGAHAIPPGAYEVSVQYGSSYSLNAASPGLNALVDGTTLTQTLPFPQERRVEFTVE